MTLEESSFLFVFKACILNVSQLTYTSNVDRGYLHKMVANDVFMLYCTFLCVCTTTTNIWGNFCDPLLLCMLTLSILDDVKILKVTNLLLFFSLWYTSQYFNFLFLSKVCKFKAWFFVANGVSRRHLFYIYPVLNNPFPSFGTKT